MCYRKLNVFCFSRLLRQHPLSVDKNCFAKVVPLWIYHYQHVAVFELPAKKKKFKWNFTVLALGLECKTALLAASKSQEAQSLCLLALSHPPMHCC